MNGRPVNIAVRRCRDTSNNPRVVFAIQKSRLDGFANFVNPLRMEEFFKVLHQAEVEKCPKDETALTRFCEYLTTAYQNQYWSNYHGYQEWAQRIKTWTGPWARLVKDSGIKRRFGREVDVVLGTMVEGRGISTMGAKRLLGVEVG
jgi:hypothetical protein